MGRIIGPILDNVYAPFVSIKYSIRSITSYFHISMVVHPGSNDNLQICNLIQASMLSLSSKKQQNIKGSLNNDILWVNYKMIINMLMNHLYITVQYIYITNRLISGKIRSTSNKLNCTNHCKWTVHKLYTNHTWTGRSVN